jgi:hypothetical protein
MTRPAQPQMARNEAPAETESAPAPGEAAGRRPYEAPRIVRRERIVASTLFSGNDCVFDPPGTC